MADSFFNAWAANAEEQYGQDGWGDDDWEPPELYVEASVRKDVEAFAKKMESLGNPEECDAPEYLPYCRMDASALLSRLAGGNTDILRKLQDALMTKDMEAFCDALQTVFFGERDFIQEMRASAQAGDKDGFAEGLRMLAQAELDRLMEDAELGRSTFREVSNPTDPLMGTERRAKATQYLGTFSLPPGQKCDAPIPIPGRPDQDAIAYCALQLGDDHATWEEECLMHPYMWDAANAHSDLMQESRGVGFLDGRTVGLRGQGIGIFG